MGAGFEETAAIDAAIEAMRGCEALWPEHARKFRAISHYRKYNRARPGELSAGDAVPDVQLGTVPLSEDDDALATVMDPKRMHNEPMPERMRRALARHEKAAREAARHAADAAASPKEEEMTDSTLGSVLGSSAASGLPTLLIAGSYS